jgi:prevent-host-death family protein
MNVGVKELKNSLSKYLRAVRRGEVVLITERGKVVAEIRPRTLRAGDDEKVFLQLEREGTVSRGRGHMGEASPVRLPRGVSASRMVIEDRG